VSESLLIGSGNANKAAELVEILRGLPWNVVTLNKFPGVTEPEETGKDFESNALIKALHYRRQCGLPCVTDDSGLEVEALGGAPGVYSARYAGLKCTYADNNAKILTALQDVPMEERTARFVCCAAFADLEGSVHIVRGTIEGAIVFNPRGTGGFGYDPIFVPENNALTFAEMTSTQKHSMSHRGRAFQGLRDYLEHFKCVS
jgi:non-canonical purine NTP pyrophosphatase (RdgB/HAM1 family)